MTAYTAADFATARFATNPAPYNPQRGYAMRNGSDSEAPWEYSAGFLTDQQMSEQGWTPVAADAPQVDLDTAGRFATALKAAGHPHVAHVVPLGIVRNALMTAFAPPRPEGAAELEAALEAVKGDHALAHIPATQIRRLADAVAAHQAGQADA